MSFASRRLLVPSLALAVAFASTAARAEAPARVTVVPYAPLYGSVPQSFGDKAASALADELGAQDSLKVVEVTDGAASKKAAAPGEAELAVAKKKVAEAKSLFSRAEASAKARKIKPAADSYERGIKLFLQGLPGADDLEPLADAHVQLAVARVRLGQEDGARKVLADLARLDPMRELREEDVSKTIVEWHAQARREAFAQQRGELKIESTPAGARVRFNGQDVGETPIVLQGVLPGTHYVSIEKPGQGAVFEQVTVEPRARETLSAELDGGQKGGPLAELSRVLAGNVLDAAAVELARTIGQKSGADFVLFGALYQPSSDFVQAKTWALRTADGALAEQPGMQFDAEMINAAIEVFKVAGDFGVKVDDFVGVKLPAAQPLFPNARAPRTSDSVTLVTVTPASIGQQAGAEEDGQRSGRRVVSGRRAPVATPAPAPRAPAVTQPEEDAADEAPRRVLRERRRIGEDPEPEPAPKAKDTRKTAEVDLSLDAKKTEPAERQIDLTPRQLPRSSNLSPEELAALNRKLEDGEGSNVGRIVLWSTVGVVGAGAIAAGVFFLLQPQSPSSATATINWTP